MEGVVPFLETLTSPVIVCNIDDSEEPTMQGKYQKSLIIDRYDRKIGIVGVILSTTNVSELEEISIWNYTLKIVCILDNC